MYRQVTGSDEPIPTSIIPSDWYRKRAIARLQCEPGQQWLDLRSPDTREALRAELAEVLLALRLSDLDLSGVIGPRRDLTQAISRWAHDHGYSGLVSRSRFDETIDCWAIFEGAAFQAIGVPELIIPEDPDLQSAAQFFGLTV